MAVRRSLRSLGVSIPSSSGYLTSIRLGTTSGHESSVVGNNWKLLEQPRLMQPRRLMNLIPGNRMTCTSVRRSTGRNTTRRIHRGGSVELKVIQQREAEDSTHYFPHLTEGPESILYLGCALGGESGEVLNDIKKWWRNQFDYELREKLRSELPDILIYLVMLADSLEIDLEEAYKEKKAYNDRRYLEGV
jgi:NTP pyrophosphatase (non-canonical NTP hydrolase)